MAWNGSSRITFFCEKNGLCFRLIQWWRWCQLCMFELSGKIERTAIRRHTGDRMGGFSLSHLSGLFSLSDEEAMLRVQKQNDPRAFAILVHRWESWTKMFCTRFTGDVHRGEDLAQEVFAQILTHRNDYRHEGRFAAYLRRIAYNACCDWHRRTKRHQESPLTGAACDPTVCDITSAAPALSPDVIVAKDEQAEVVRKALFQLPEHYRHVIILRHYEGLRFREIAELLDLSPGTVRSRMAEALTRLARLLKPVLNEEVSDSTRRHGTEKPDREENL
jgi:RNA polymerase sigma-70 factor (ECF subfamily)